MYRNYVYEYDNNIKRFFLFEMKKVSLIGIMSCRYVSNFLLCCMSLDFMKLMFFLNFVWFMCYVVLL